MMVNNKKLWFLVGMVACSGAAQAADGVAPVEIINPLAALTRQVDHQGSVIAGLVKTQARQGQVLGGQARFTDGIKGSLAVMDGKFASQGVKIVALEHQLGMQAIRTANLELQVQVLMAAELQTGARLQTVEEFLGRFQSSVDARIGAVEAGLKGLDARKADRYVSVKK